MTRLKWEPRHSYEDRYVAVLPGQTLHVFNSMLNPDEEGWFWQAWFWQAHSLAYGPFETMEEAITDCEKDQIEDHHD